MPKASAGRLTQQALAIWLFGYFSPGRLPHYLIGECGHAVADFVALFPTSKQNSGMALMFAKHDPDLWVCPVRKRA